jgi:hypothetical protein
MATKTKKSAKSSRKKTPGTKKKQTLLADYNSKFANITNLLLTGLGAMGVIVEILFKTGNGEIGKNTKHSNMPLMASFQTEPEIQGQYVEAIATFADAEYRFPAYCFGNNPRGDVRRVKTIMKQIDPPIILLSLDNIFGCAKFGDIEDLLFDVLDIAKQLQRNVRVPFCIASPTVELPVEFYAWADAIFDCDVVGDPGRLEIEDITGEAK